MQRVDVNASAHAGGVRAASAAIPTRASGRLVRDDISVDIFDGEVRALSFRGDEFLRGVSAPLRDRDWGTIPLNIFGETFSETLFERRFGVADGSAEGWFRIELVARREIQAEFRLSVSRRLTLNRAGFTLLHPIQGLAGSALELRHSDGRREASCFPSLVARAQPALDIVGMRYTVAQVAVDITFEGEIFEMEDQRNWSDASFKTYCRPLSWPRPYDLDEGEVVLQRVKLTLGEVREYQARPQASTSSIVQVSMPEILLAHDHTLGPVLGGAWTLPMLVRVGPDTSDAYFTSLAELAKLAVEIVCDSSDELEGLVQRLAALPGRLLRAVALPHGYLKSHQPEGPWPEGMTPADALVALRRLLPDVPLGAGSLTHFTEANRCPIPPFADFLTFGNAAIVHAADDMSVIQTLEAMPDIFASAKALLPGKPLHLGLFSIGLRSNPYGAAVAANLQGLRLPMAMTDPRQDTEFAAAYAGAVLALAALSGCGSLALAMADGPLGAKGRPIGNFLRHVAELAGQPVEISTRPGSWSVRGSNAGYSVSIVEGQKLHLDLHGVADGDQGASA